MHGTINIKYIHLADVNFTTVYVYVIITTKEKASFSPRSQFLVYSTMATFIAGDFLFTSENC